MTGPVRVKICGLTRLDDALAALAAGADALGFVFHAASKRSVTPDQAAAILAGLPPLVTTVAVVVNRPAAELRALKDRLGVSLIQLSGDERPADAAALPAPLLKSFRAAPADLADWLALPNLAGLLGDGAAPGSYGGTGHGAAPDVLAALAPTGRMILAGGLTPDNVAEAVRRWRPAAVDVASGVEAAPGIKDPARLAAFIRAAKAAYIS